MTSVSGRMICRVWWGFFFAFTLIFWIDEGGDRIAFGALGFLFPAVGFWGVLLGVDRGAINLFWKFSWVRSRDSSWEPLKVHVDSGNRHTVMVLIIWGLCAFLSIFAIICNKLEAFGPLFERLSHVSAKLMSRLHCAAATEKMLDFQFKSRLLSVRMFMAVFFACTLVFVERSRYDTISPYPLLRKTEMRAVRQRPSLKSSGLGVLRSFWF